MVYKQLNTTAVKTCSLELLWWSLTLRSDVFSKQTLTTTFLN